MATSLGKRKLAVAQKEEESEDDKAQLQALLQRHFEARFAPLDPTFSQPADAEDEDDDDEDEDTDMDSSSSEWGGISQEDSEDETPRVEIIDHTTTSNLPDPTLTMSKREVKAYLSSKPPTATSTTTSLPTKPSNTSSEAEDSASLLANDLALQRLIAESHILSAAGHNPSHYLSSAASTTQTQTRAFAEGRTRLKTTDMRIQALGGKGSILAQAKMPMAMRKGIIKSAETKEEKRRREARENGIVLERLGGKRGKGRVVKKGGFRERDLNASAVGKMRGAELKISKREIREIEAEGKKRERGGRRRRR